LVGDIQIVKTSHQQSPRVLWRPARTDL